MKKLILILFLCVLPLAVALEECKPVLEPPEVPCRITSTWNYTPPCSAYTVVVFNSTGDNFINYTFADYGSSGLCNATFNVTEKGSYSYLVDGNGDSGNIVVELTNMSLNLVIGIGIVAALLLWLSFKLEKEHFFLKLLLIISSVTFLLLIPLSTFMPATIGSRFYTLFLWVFVAFWLYVGVYLVYWVLKKLNEQVKQT